ncbi:hypothetical protein [Pseudomonas sp. LB1P83]
MKYRSGVTHIDPQTPEHRRTAATRDILQALPALRALGLFELMQVRHPVLGALCDHEQGGPLDIAL